jgi:hypothetical protein
MISEVDGYWFEIRQISKNHVRVSVFIENPQKPRGIPSSADQFIPLKAWLIEQFIPFIVTRDCSVPLPEKDFSEEKILAEGARRSAEAIRFEIVKVGIPSVVTLTEDDVLHLILDKRPRIGSTSPTKRFSTAKPVKQELRCYQNC